MCFRERSKKIQRSKAYPPIPAHFPISLLPSLLFLSCLLVASYNNQILYFLFWMGNTSVPFPIQSCGLLRALWVYGSAPVLKGHTCLSQVLWSSCPFSKYFGVWLGPAYSSVLKSPFIFDRRPSFQLLLFPKCLETFIISCATLVFHKLFVNNMKISIYP